MPPTDNQNRPPVVHITNQSAPSQSGMGPVIGAIIVVILLIFGALYFWGQKMNRNQAPETPLLVGGVTLE